MNKAGLQRVFRYNSIELEDPGPDHDPVDVRNLYSATYPEITSAAIEGPEKKDDKLVYTFRRAVGTKGAASLRPHLQSIATGAPQACDAGQVEPGVVETHAAAFGAWRDFAAASLEPGGERLAAPASTLVPLA